MITNSQCGVIRKVMMVVVVGVGGGEGEQSSKKYSRTRRLSENIRTL